MKSKTVYCVSFNNKGEHYEGKQIIGFTTEKEAINFMRAEENDGEIIKDDSSGWQYFEISEYEIYEKAEDYYDDQKKERIERLEVKINYLKKEIKRKKELHKKLISHLK